MNIMQTTVERLLYTLLFLLFVGMTVIGGIAYSDGQQIKQVVSNQEELVKKIKSDQSNNGIAIKTYIACLISIPPLSTDITTAEKTCFNSAPQVK